jgi:hypothetical protein
MELHEIGPVKIFDTAGINETGELGSKKVPPTPPRHECSVALIFKECVRFSRAHASSVNCRDIVVFVNTVNISLS